MKRLTDDLKRMLDAMALQDTVDLLPMRSNPDTLSPSSPRRVAALSDGQGSDKVLAYALDACQRQQASLDLVLYGAAREQAEEIRTQLEQCGIAYEIILLCKPSVDALVEYIHARRTLTYLVARADDPLAIALTEETAPHRSERLHLPMVLVDHSAQSCFNRINAA